MKKPSLALLLITFFCLNNNLLFGQNTTETAQKAWKLIWHDEFNGKTLIKKKWNVLTRETSKHGELQYYIPDEVYLQDGNLRNWPGNPDATTVFPQYHDVDYVRVYQRR